MKPMKFLIVLTFAIILFLFLSSVQAVRLPSVGGDQNAWGTILNEFLNTTLGINGTQLNVSGFFVNKTTGNVGIGTQNPSGKLHITTSGNDNTLVINDSTGYLGIGTDNSSTNIHISGTDELIRLSDNDAVSDIAAKAYITYYRGDTTNRIGYSGFSGADGGFEIATDHTGGYVRFRTGNQVEAVLFDSFGNVGINTSTPTNTLNVVGDLNVTGTSYLGDVVLDSDNITINNVVTKDGNISFVNSSGAETIRIINDGWIGITNIAPQTNVHVSGTDELIRLSDSDAVLDSDVKAYFTYYRGDATNRIGFSGFSGADGGFEIATDHTGGYIRLSTGNQVEALLVDSTGNVNVTVGNMSIDNGNFGINVSSPTRPLHISDVMRLEARSSAPTDPSLGDVYVDSDTLQFCFYNSTNWVGLVNGSVTACA